MNLNFAGNPTLSAGTIYGRISDITPGRPSTDQERAFWERMTKEREDFESYAATYIAPPKKVYAEIVVNGEVVAEVWENNIVQSYDWGITCRFSQNLPGDGPDLSRRRAEFIAEALNGEIRYPPKQTSNKAEPQATPSLDWTETYWGKELLAKPHWSIELEELTKISLEKSGHGS